MRQHRRGFTLLELLTVIAILGLLVGILLPSLSAARAHAKANTCLSHLKGIGNAFAVYLTENNDILPPFRMYKYTPGDLEYYVNDAGRRAPRWQWFLETELGPVVNPTKFRWSVSSVGSFGDYTFARPGMTRDGRTMAHELFTCPSLKDEEFAMDIRNGAYGYNYQYLGNTRVDRPEGEQGPTLWNNYPVGMHRIKNTGMTVLVADSRGAGFRHGRHSYTLDPPRLATERRATRFGPNEKTYAAPSPTELLTEETESDNAWDLGDMPEGLGSNADVYSYSPVEARHKDRGNVLFLDTHAEAMTLSELGYQLSDGTTPDRVRPGVPLPVRDPVADGAIVTNRLWNGDGVDTMTAGRHDIPDP